MAHHRTALATLRSALTLLVLLGGIAIPQEPRAQSAAPLELASYPRTDLTITQSKPARVHSFRVWVADTPQRAEQGLMFVNDLPESEGMVFPLEPPRVENMWMKNTYIELDMVFIAADGRVVKIIERAHPLSLETITSGTPVAAVLELKGGTAAKLGLRVGDAVRWKKPAAA
ncbi:MAG TPA: DUF192 domain-containing protein [Steroidobacteraceae bacterium]|nr:DUF192 domain-containing protein [Steroidobacteraceae bacterium]